MRSTHPSQRPSYVLANSGNDDAAGITVSVQPDAVRAPPSITNNAPSISTITNNNTGYITNNSSPVTKNNTRAATMDVSMGAIRGSGSGVVNGTLTPLLRYSNYPGALTPLPRYTYPGTQVL